MNACETTPHLPSKGLAPNHHATESVEEAKHSDKRSYRDSLRAMFLTGSSSLVEMLVRVVKSKAIALCVGPEGIGLFGILTAATSLIRTATNFGLAYSGVRQVAAASGSMDTVRISRVVYTLRRTSLATGLLGMFVVVAFAGPISKLTTGSSSYAHFLAILGPLILLENVRGGQTALLRGLRKIRELARLRVFGAIAATLLSVPLVFVWGLNGIAPAMLLAAAAACGASWLYARRIRIAPVALDAQGVLSETYSLFSLGAAFLLNGIQKPFVDNTLRGILAWHTDLHSVGQFLAASALSQVYVGFIIEAMGMDYLPRLTQHKEDPNTCNRLINEQMEISLLIAIPGICYLLFLAPVLIPLFYSNRFGDSIGVFRWQCLGTLLRVAAWPIGLALVAKAHQTAFLVTQTATNAIHIGVFYVLVKMYGLTGAAIAAAIIQFLYMPLVYLTVRSLTGFRWSPAVWHLLLGALATYALSCCITLFLSRTAAVFSGLSLSLGASVFCYRAVCQRTGLKPFRAVVDRAFARVNGEKGKRFRVF
jgi:antigen flippase